MQTYKQLFLNMIIKLLLCSQKFKTAEIFEDNIFPIDSPIKRSLALISIASTKSKVPKYHNKRQIQKENPEAIFDIFPQRFLNPINLHAHIQASHGSHRRCVWCRIMNQKKKVNDIDGNCQKEVTKAQRVCMFCSSKNNN